MERVKRTGLVIATCIPTGKQWVGYSRNIDNYPSALLSRGTMPRTMAEDREKYRRVDDREIWNFEMIPVPAETPKEELVQMKDAKVQELNSMAPNGYNLSSGKSICHETKLLISDSTRASVAQ